jgi:TRAP-type mannitol/chloroaromatic compound transport system substrate-binding protein
MVFGKSTLMSAALGTLAAATLVATADAQDTTRWRMHSAYAKALPVAGNTAFKIAETVKLLSGGKFDIRVFEPGALVAGAQYYDAVSKGSINAAYGSPGFNAGKNSAYNFFAAVPFGPSTGEMLAWLRYGGGLALARELYARDNLYMMPCGILPPESAGWFRKEIKSLEDFKGLKMRFFGLGAKVMERFGVSPQLLAPGEVYQALELGTIDAAEQSVPAIDRGLGFYKVAKFNYFPGWHQPSTVQELVINLANWKSLNDGQRKMIEVACDEATIDQYADGEAGQFDILKKNEADGVKIVTYPDEFIKAFRSEWEKVIAAEIAANPDSKKVWESLSAFRNNYKIWGERAYLK